MAGEFDLHVTSIGPALDSKIQPREINKDKSAKITHRREREETFLARRCSRRAVERFFLAELLDWL